MERLRTLVRAGWTKAHIKPMGGTGPTSISSSAHHDLRRQENVTVFLPSDSRARYQIAQWVAWQLASQNPKLREKATSDVE